VSRPRVQGSTAERGYGAAHQRERERLRPLVDAGLAYCQQPVCLMTARRIEPGTPWALGHNDARTAWIGPTHALCNAHDGAVKAGRVPPRPNRAPDSLRGRTSRCW
jgi:hypothetical protein